MISSDLLLLGMAVISGAMALALLLYALRIYRHETREPGESREVAPEQSPGQETAGPPDSLAREMNPERMALAQPKTIGPELSHGPVKKGLEEANKPIATILRHQQTGQIVVQVKGQNYLEARNLKQSSDWLEVQGAIMDLLRWISAAEEIQAIPQAAEISEPAKPKSMIEEINEILDTMSSGANGILRGVRLIEGDGGSVKVLVGVDSYDLEGVPNPEVSNLIRKAVVEWESRQ